MTPTEKAALVEVRDCLDKWKKITWAMYKGQFISDELRDDVESITKSLNKLDEIIATPWKPEPEVDLGMVREAQEWLNNFEVMALALANGRRPNLIMVRDTLRDGLPLIRSLLPAAKKGEP